MAVGFYNFKELHNEKLQQEVLKRFEEIVKTNGFVEGKYNSSFEERFAKMQGTNKCLLVANGTDALEIALQAYGVGAGDKVGIAAISFYATAECVVNVGATPVFVDVDPVTGLMDPASLERVLAKHELKAIIPVHIYGLPAPIEALEKICAAKGIKIVEDGAQSQGGFYENGKPIGSSNHLITYSFYPTKNLGAFGDAGAILTQDETLAEEIISIRNHGRSPDGHKLIGRNSRCDHLQAAVLDAKLDAIEEQNKSRKEIAKKYHEALKGLDIRLVPDKFLELSSWHLYPIGLKTREQKYALKDHLASKQIGAALFYEKALPEEKPIANLAGETENSLSFAAETVCIPMNPFVTDEEINTVCTEIKNFLNQ
jgi:dTDP-4-amino-4,6-dideoxygalactose transaminase